MNWVEAERGMCVVRMSVVAVSQIDWKWSCWFKEVNWKATDPSKRSQETYHLSVANKGSVS